MTAHWTHDDDERLRRLIRTGTPWKHIKRITGRTFRAARMRLFRLNETCDAIRHTPDGCRSIRETAHLLGISGHTMSRWIRRGYVHATKPARQAGQRYITDDALRRFLCNPEYWMLWSPTIIHDSDWRHYAESERQLADGRWIRLTDIAQATGYHVETLRAWHRDGTIPGAVRRGQVTYFWSRALDGWPPLQGRRL